MSRTGYGRVGARLGAMMMGGALLGATAAWSEAPDTPAPSQPRAVPSTATPPATTPPAPRARSGSSSSAASSPLAGLFGRGDPLKDGPVAFDVTVVTGDEDLRKTIRNASLITATLQDGRFTGQDVLAAARADYGRILGVLYDAGHYSNVVNIRLDGREAASIPPLDAPARVDRVEVTVNPGPPFHFSRAQIAPVAAGTELPREYRSGELARSSTMKSAANAGVDGWRKGGHAKAKVAETDIIADHALNTVDSRIALAPGPLVRFGDMTIAGQKAMRPERIAAIAGFPSGDVFDPAKLDQVRKRLRRSGVFSAITLTESEVLRPGNIEDVHLTVIEQKKRRVGGGVEYSTTDGTAIALYWMHRNLFGGAERLRIDGSVKDIGSGSSGRDLALSARFERPATFRPDLTAYVSASAARQREEDYDEDLGVIGAGMLWQPSDRLTGELGLEYRQSRVKDETGTTRFRLLALPATVTWDKRDVTTDPKSGYWLQGTLTPFVGSAGTSSGLRALAEARGYRSFGEDDRITLAGRLRTGTIWGGDLPKTPRDYLFFSGGGGSVRGQPYQSLGVKVIESEDGETVLTGGMSLVNLSAELRYQLRPKIGLAAFVDGGRVWTDSGWTGESGWQAGAGIGVRYKTPIGPIRLDVARPTGGDTGKGTQVYLGLGQAF